MNGRRLLLALAACALLAAGAAGGVALGSSRDAPPKDAQQVPQPTGRKVIKCKAQACAHWNTTGQLVGQSKNVISVLHLGTGQYCVQLDARLTVSGSMTVLVSTDYNNGTPGFAQGFDVQAAATPCGVNGVRLIGWRHDSAGGSVTEDAAGYLVVP